MHKTQSPRKALQRALAEMREQESLLYSQWLWTEQQRDSIMELAIDTVMKAYTEGNGVLDGEVLLNMLLLADDCNQLLARSQAAVQAAEVGA